MPMGQAPMRGVVAFQHRPGQGPGKSFGPCVDPKTAKDCALAVIGKGGGKRRKGFEVDMGGQVGLARMGEGVVRDMLAQGLQRVTF